MHSLFQLGKQIGKSQGLTAHFHTSHTGELQVQWQIVSKNKVGTREIAHWLGPLGALQEDPGSNSYHPHGSSKPSVTTIPGI